MSSKDKKSKKKKKPKGISSNFESYAAKQSYLELAGLRENNRKLMQDIRDQRHDLIDNVGETALFVDPNKKTRFEMIADKSSILFEEVNRMRELVNSTQSFNELGSIILDQVTSANNFAKLSTQRIIDKIKEKYPISSSSSSSSSSFPSGTIEIDWVAMGRATSALFNAPPRTAFLHGPLMRKEHQVQAARKRKGKRKRDTTGQATHAATLNNLNDKDDRDVTIELSTRIFNIVIEFNQIHHVKMNFFELIIDPGSFPRSIENWFATLILFKEGHLRLQMSDKNLPMVYAPTALHLDDNVDEQVYQGPSQIVSEEVMQFSQAPEGGAESYQSTKHCVGVIDRPTYQKLRKAICKSKNVECSIGWTPMIPRDEDVIDLNSFNFDDNNNNNNNVKRYKVETDVSGNIIYDNNNKSSSSSSSSSNISSSSGSSSNNSSSSSSSSVTDASQKNAKDAEAKLKAKLIANLEAQLALLKE